MDYVYVTKENIEQEHICCAISSNSDVQVRSKKDWLTDRFEDGLVFIKSSVRGKCFIEYIPAKNAWIPIDADNYMYIDCLWVAGSLKGHGYSSELLNLCIEDSKKKGMDGICILSSKKKMPYLADPKFLAYKGFRVCDEASNGIQLWYLELLMILIYQNLNLVLRIVIYLNLVLSYIIQANVLLMRNMFQSLKICLKK